MLRKDLEEIVEYIPGKPISAVQKAYGLKKIVKLASNEVPWEPFPAAQKAIKDALKTLNRYPDSECADLREKLSKHHKVPAECVLIGNGSNELVRLIVQVALDKGDEVVMAHPSFIVYKEVTKVMRGKAIEVPLNKDFKHDLPAMKKAVTKRTKVIFICNPNNPTGTSCSKAEIDKFLKGLTKDIIVVFDEAYFEFAEGKDHVDGMNYFSPGRNIVILRTFSKIYGLAGLRVGYGFASKDIARLINKVREPFHINTPALAAASASLDCRTELKQRVKAHRSNKKLLEKGLKNLGISWVPSDANFLLVDLKRNSEALSLELLKMGMIVRSGTPFGYPEHIRVTVGTAAENEFFLKCLKKALN